MAPRDHERFAVDGMTFARIAPQTLARSAPEGLPLQRATARTGWTYFGHAAVHPSNLLLLIGVMFLSLILWNSSALFAGLGAESVFLLVVPRCGFFRRRVDELLDEVERAAATKAREALVLQMCEAHRQELNKIDILVGKTFSNVERHGGMPPGDREGLSRLSAGYVRLAIAHRACEESLAMTNRHALEGTIRALEAAAASSTDRTRDVLQRRLSIAYQRVECWNRTRENLEAISQQLATIAELAQLVHQESLAPPDADATSVCEAIDRVMAAYEENAMVRRELAEIRIEEPYELGELGAEAAVLLARRA